jgi:hypothetical protein
VVSNDRADLEQILSRAFGREIAFVEVRAEGIVSGVAEEYLARPLEHTSTIDRLRKLYPQDRFGSPIPPQHRRIDWQRGGGLGGERLDRGRTVGIGDTVRPALTEPCVMIRLPQGDLPKDSGILRTAAQHNAVHVGVFTSVVNGGTTRRDDPGILDALAFFMSFAGVPAEPWEAAEFHAVNGEIVSESGEAD